MVFRSRGSLLILLVLVALSAEGFATDERAGFLIIANPSTPVTTLSSERAARIFTKKESTWSDGVPILPVDLKGSSRVRSRFTKIVHGKSVEAIRNYWRKQIFTGREVPPVEKPNEEAVVEFVRNNAGAIGYVSAHVSPRGVKIIHLEN